MEIWNLVTYFNLEMERSRNYDDEKKSGDGGCSST